MFRQKALIATKTVVGRKYIRRKSVPWFGSRVQERFLNTADASVGKLNKKRFGECSPFVKEREVILRVHESSERTTEERKGCT